MASNAAVRGLGASSPQVVAPQAKKKWPLVQLYRVWGLAPSAAGGKKLASSTARGAEITQTYAEFVRSTQSSWRKTKPAVDPPRHVLCGYERRLLSKVFGVDVSGSRLTAGLEKGDKNIFFKKRRSYKHRTQQEQSIAGLRFFVSRLHVPNKLCKP